MGEVRVDAEADVRGREALVRAFTATALGLRISAHGIASFDALALDLDVRAPDLKVVAAAVGAFRKERSPPFSGSAHLSAHVTGSPRAPDAEIHLRAPAAQLAGQFDARSLAIDGTLHGALAAPDGNLSVAADALDMGQIALRSPRIVHMATLVHDPPSTDHHRVIAATPSGSAARKATVTGANGAGTAG